MRGKATIGKDRVRAVDAQWLHFHVAAEDKDERELYHVDVDRSESTNLAKPINACGRRVDC